MTIASLVTTRVVGKLLDKIGAKPVMVVGGAITALGMIILGFSSNLYLFSVAVALIGIGNASIVGNALYYIFLDETEKSQRASGQALLNILLSTGSLIGWAILGSTLALCASGAASFRMFISIWPSCKSCSPCFLWGLEAKKRSRSAGTN